MSEFAELVDAHYQPLYRFGHSLTRCPERAADLVQDNPLSPSQTGSPVILRPR